MYFRARDIDALQASRSAGHRPPSRDELVDVKALVDEWRRQRERRQLELAWARRRIARIAAH